MKRIVTIVVLSFVAVIATGCASRGQFFGWGSESATPVYYAAPAATEICR